MGPPIDHLFTSQVKQKKSNVVRSLNLFWGKGLFQQVKPNALSMNVILRPTTISP